MKILRIGPISRCHGLDLQHCSGPVCWMLTPQPGPTAKWWQLWEEHQIGSFGSFRGCLQVPSRGTMLFCFFSQTGGELKNLTTSFLLWCCLIRVPVLSNYFANLSLVLVTRTENWQAHQLPKPNENDNVCITCGWVTQPNQLGSTAKSSPGCQWLPCACTAQQLEEFGVTRVPEKDNVTAKPRMGRGL